jgi:hypothetical protein
MLFDRNCTVERDESSFHVPDVDPSVKNDDFDDAGSSIGVMVCSLSLGSWNSVCDHLDFDWYG